MATMEKAGDLRRVRRGVAEVAPETVEARFPADVAGVVFHRRDAPQLGPRRAGGVLA